MPVTAMDLSLGPARNSPKLVADPTDRRFVVAATRIDARTYSCGLEVSGDGGQGWVGATPVPTLPAGAERCYAPEVAFDRDGRLYYLFVGLHTVGNVPMGAFLTVSTDRGRTFSPPVQVLGPIAFGVRMAIDTRLGNRGRIHLAWLQAGTDPAVGALPSGTNPILTAFSDDGGKTFSEPVTVSEPSRPLAVAPALVLGPDRTVHVLYYDLVDDRRDSQGLEGPVWEGTWSLVLATSTDGGRRFGPGRVVEPAVVPTERVMLIFTMPAAAIVSGPAGALFVAWPDARNGDADVLLRHSPDGGATWDAPVRLNDDAVGNGRTQSLPQLGVSPKGRVDAVFYDRRNDPDNTQTDVFYTSSADGGRTFAPSVRLNRQSFDSRVGRRYGLPSSVGLVEFGSRLGLLSEDTRALAAWADSRNSIGRPGQSGPNHQDIYAAEVRVGSR